ncbi:transposable element Tcb1 transposase [Trichonephila clavipes]|nr:transposable element Tcb1 transposase [Trichonephila clavipes]
MIVQFRNEKVSNHGSIPITIDCNVVAFIVFEEGFHQPIKRTKQYFNDTSDSQRQFTWKEVKTRFHPSNITEKERYGGPGAVIWGGNMLHGWTKLHVFDKGSVTGDFYCKAVILPHVVYSEVAIGPDFVFMDDNARPHWTADVQQLLESENITLMDLPAFSPVLTPIEHVWKALGRCLAARLHPPGSTQQLKQILIEDFYLKNCWSIRC